MRKAGSSVREATTIYNRSLVIRLDAVNLIATATTNGGRLLMNSVRIWALVALTAIPFASGPAIARTMETGDFDVVQNVTPAVVSIATWKMRPPANAGDPPRRVKTSGSGFIIDPTGIIVTNKHVIDGALNITVLFSDGDRARATLVAVSALVDLAVLKVDVNRPLSVLKWGNSEALRVGHAVLAIGNPLGLGMSVSAGIVSALNRDIEDTPFDNYIQTDAAINHGNSGGPMVDLNGDVVGVDTALYNPDEVGGFIGIGLAIPAETAKFVVARLLDPSHPKPGWLGVKLQDVTPELSDALHGAKGSIIAAADQGGPVSRAGLRPGDVLASIGGVKPRDTRAFMREIVMIPVGQSAPLTVWRGGKEQVITVTIEEWPNYMPGGGIANAQMAEAMILKAPDPGVKLAPVTDAARKQYGLDPNLAGALVASVESDCEARDLGIVAGDVVTAVQGTPVATPDDVRHAIEVAHGQHDRFLAVLVEGKSGARWVSLSIGGAGS
jgi:serine protease Do